MAQPPRMHGDTWGPGPRDAGGRKEAEAPHAWKSRSAELGRTPLFHPWAHEPEGWVVGRQRSVSHFVRSHQGSGFDGLGWVPLGPKRARQGPVWSRLGPYISRTPIWNSRVICRGSSDPLGPYRVPTGFRRNPVLARRDPMIPDGARRIARLSRIGARLMYGPIRDPTASPRALQRPVGTRWAPGGPPAAPSDPA